MATLAETAYQTRKAINWLILAIICYFVLRLFWSVFVSTWIALFPPKPAPPNHRFGKLPILRFPPEEASPSGGIKFKLETIEGTVPSASDSATVFFMNKSPANLLALSATQDFAERLGLTRIPIAESKNLYRFEDADVALRTLRYDIVSRNFVLSYDYSKDSSLFVNRDIPQEDAARAEAVSQLQSYNLYPDDVARGTIRVSFLKIIGDTLVPTTSLSASDALRIDFFRRDIAGLKIFTSMPDHGPIFFIFSGSPNIKKRVIAFSYRLWPIDYETYATYAVKPSSQAWEELKSGHGHIARYPKAGNTATVRNVYLAYYDSTDPQTYLQPIFVFEGDYGFLGYVQAVSGEWME